MSEQNPAGIIRDVMASFLSYSARVLPDDVYAKLRELRDAEDDPMAMSLYDAMFRNLELARELDRPACQDTGIPQFWIKCGSEFPYIGIIEKAVTDAVVKATHESPLRPNAVETFDEINTGNNIADGAPIIFWDIEAGRDDCEIYTYLAGGGSALPGQAMVMMPSAGYESIANMVLDRMTSYGLNACPPLLVGIGIGYSAETAALNSKKALMRPVGSHNENEKAAAMEKLLEDGINAIGIAPHGLGGKSSVLGVNIVNTARHPATLGAAVSIGCWCHRRGRIVFDRDLGYTVTTHSGFTGNK